MTLCQQLCLSIHPLKVPDSASTMIGAAVGWANAEPVEKTAAARKIRERGVFIGTGLRQPVRRSMISAEARGRRKAYGNVRDAPRNR
jgi:hypothetical protein